MRCTALLATALTALASVAAADTNHCEIAVTGESNATIKVDAPRGTAQGKLGASTDYWLTDMQVRKAIQLLQSVGSKLTAAEKQRKVDEAMKHDPRFMLLLITCLADEGGIIMVAAKDSKYADVPMKPASYAIVPARQTRAGEFLAMFHLSPGGKRESYLVKEPGKLVISKFDRKSLAGTFSFTAEQPGKTRKVSVTGSFSFHCTGDACDK